MSLGKTNDFGLSLVEVACVCCKKKAKPLTWVAFNPKKEPPLTFCDKCIKSGKATKFLKKQKKGG